MPEHEAKRELDAIKNVKNQALENVNKQYKIPLEEAADKETRKKIGNANRNPSSLTRQKMSAAKKGIKKSPEHRRKMSEAAKKRWSKIS